MDPRDRNGPGKGPRRPAGAQPEPPDPTPGEVADLPTGTDPGPGGLPLAGVPDAIGHYRILRLLGEGGMGVVFEAEQQDPKRAVALKVIRGGAFVDKTRVRMFQREVQTLARLKHPAIAAIYESGRTPDGQHFFAMELVRGDTLKRWLVERPADGGMAQAELRLRLALFRRICDGVAYAHQRGVVHRDLKPSNLLILRETELPSGSAGPGVPGIKILDFGLARITDSDLAATTVVTDIGKVQGTLTYMSPEQVRGNPDEIDLRTDVYSLGVILYEMLTGSLPYDLGSKALAEASQVICEAEPRPLARVWPGGRRADRDLETILRKALEKEPARRYQSVTALAEDVERYLALQPILARPPSTLYLLRKMIRRHRVGFAFAAALGVVLAAFAATMAVQAERIARERDRANQEARTASEVSEFLVSLFEVSDPGEARGKTVTAREILENGARRIRQGLGDQPSVRARLLHTMGRVYRRLGLYAESRTLLDEAAATHADLPEQDSSEVVAILYELGSVLRITGAYSEAETVFQRGLEAAEARFGPDHPEVARVLNGQAALFRDVSRFPEAKAALRRALEIDERNYGPEDARVAQSLSGLASALADGGDYREAEPLHRRALEIREKALGPEDPDTAQSLNSLGNLYANLGDYDRARSHLERSLAIREKVLDPGHADLAAGYNDLAALLGQMGRYDDSIRLLERAVAVHEKVFGPKHVAVARDLHNLGNQHWEKGDYPAARRYHERSLGILEKVLAPDHKDVAMSLEAVGDVLVDMGEYEEARRYYERAVPIDEKLLGPDSVDFAWSLAGLGNILTRTGDHVRARTVLERSVALREKGLSADHPDLAWSLFYLAALDHRTGDLSRAREGYERGIAIMERALGPDDSSVAFGRNGLAAVLAAQGDGPQALAEYERALRIYEAAFGPDHPDVARGLHGIAGILKERRDYPGARERYERALRIREARLGRHHPDYIETEAEYSDLRRRMGG